ncbi:MAG: CTP synthase [Candidatus Methanofastidiosia archaeon]
MRYIIVTGGVLSGLGKGLTTATIAKLLQSMNFSVNPIKIDPYVNIDAGTMSPIEHGEVFVLDDGSEVDLDLGNYERFLNMSLTSAHNITTGKIYKNVIEKERKGEYLGKTVQIIPHVTDEIKDQIRATANNHDFMVIELGGTVGDIESMPFLEAARQLANEGDVMFVHVVPILQLSVVGEQKTKPAQHSVRELMAAGIKPDMLVCRTSSFLQETVRKKIALFCNVKESQVIENQDVDDIYKLPLLFNKQHVGEQIMYKFGLKGTVNLKKWESTINVEKREEVHIALVGKYTKLHDSYISILEALKHASYKTHSNIRIHWIGAESISTDEFVNYDGILVPGGFGLRGAKGKIDSIKYAREHNVPFLGLCYGFQLAVVELAQNCGIKDAVSSEFETKGTCVIDFLESQKHLENMGATMRLGASKILIKKDTKTYDIYGKSEVYERHRHRLEVVHSFMPIYEANGAVFSGTSPDGRMEILEIPSHPFFLATQFHPEFMSRVEKPAPTFVGFLNACKLYRKQRVNL